MPKANMRFYNACNSNYPDIKESANKLKEVCPSFISLADLYETVYNLFPDPGRNRRCIYWTNYSTINQIHMIFKDLHNRQEIIKLQSKPLI